jgi:uncharacterized protein
MDNNIINSLCETLASHSIASLKFNFRGVNGSQGIFDNGEGETEDVRAAISYALSLKEADQNRLGLAGYSAGAVWGLSAASQDSRVKALAAISPPLTKSDFAFLKNYHHPKLLISGSEDELSPEKTFLGFCNSLPDPKECYSVKQADHFWLGFESEASTRVASFFSQHLQP